LGQGYYCRVNLATAAVRGNGGPKGPQSLEAKESHYLLWRPYQREILR
jgi:hypothetical protein